MRALIATVIVALTNAVHAECPHAPASADEVFAAAECFEREHDIEHAISAYELVAFKNPSSEHVEHALWRAAELHARIGNFAAAATRFENYARRFPAKRNTSVAITTALRFREALGGHIKLEAVKRLAIKHYGEKWLRELRFGKTGDELAILTHVERGLEAWRESCKREGLCTRMIDAHPQSCDPRRTQLATVMRIPARARKAITELERAIALFDAARPAAPDVRAAYLRAKLVLADRDFEALVALPFPKLTFHTTGASARSNQRFRAWLDAQQGTGSKLLRRYEAILQDSDPASRVAAALRIAQFDRTLANRFIAAEVPRDMRRGPYFKEKRDSYCEVLAHHITPLELRANEGFAQCVMRANATGVHDANASTCIRELELARPEEFPPLREKTASVGWVDVALEREAEQ